MIGGSMASSAHGEPRSSQDVDLVADLTPERVAPFLAALGGAFYADPEAVADAVRRTASFNVIHFEWLHKIDVFCLRDDDFSQVGLARAEPLDLGDGRIPPVAAAGYMVVEKLRWYRRGGEISDRQWRDVQGMLQVEGPRLDIEEIRRWSDQVGVRDLLERALSQAGITRPE